jgi:hypothetical protein
MRQSKGRAVRQRAPTRGRAGKKYRVEEGRGAADGDVKAGGGGAAQLPDPDLFNRTQLLLREDVLREGLAPNPQQGSQQEAAAAGVAPYLDSLALLRLSEVPQDAAAQRAARLLRPLGGLLCPGCQRCTKSLRAAAGGGGDEAGGPWGGLEAELLELRLLAQQAWAQGANAERELSEARARLRELHAAAAARVSAVGAAVQRAERSLAQEAARLSAVAAEEADPTGQSAMTMMMQQVG